MASVLRFDEWQNSQGEVLASGADGSVQFPGRRNLIYNGAMQVAQRGTSTASITTSGYYTADRWNLGLSSFGTWTQTLEADGPTGSGFTKSLKVECTTADAAPAAGDFGYIYQRLEGQDLQRLKKGTSNAESLTLSFWVKSNVTGTYVVGLLDADNSRLISSTYSVTSSGAWEKKTVTFAGDTTGALDNDNALSLQLEFWLGAGTDFTSGALQTSWASTVSANRAAGQTNLAAATSNYWQVTGVQLEAGTVATSFEHKPFGQELAECQRYYEKSYNVDVAPGTSTTAGVIQEIGGSDTSGNTASAVSFLVSKRIAPTITLYSATGVQGDWLYFRNGASGETTASAPFVGETRMRVDVASVGAAFAVVGVRGHFVADAEL